MNWYTVKLEVFRGKMRSAYYGGQHGTSLSDAKKRLELSFQKGGWFDDDVTKLTLELEYDEKQTNLFNEKDLWGPYM